MDKWTEQTERVGAHVDVRWQAQDVEAQLTRLHARRRTRARRRAIASSLAVIAMAVVVGRSIVGVREDVPPREVAADRPAVPPPAAPQAQGATLATAARVPEAPPAASTELALGDGSVVMPLGKDSRLLARSVSDTEITVALAQGAARFDVPDRKTRRFLADLGTLALETHGAAFRVRITRRQIEVVAERGQLIVRGSRERRVIAAGETVTFVVAMHDGVAAAPGGHDEPPPPREPPGTWREDAGRGDYAAAWAALERTRAAMDGMEDLLLAGDVARLAGHPDAAVAPLARAVALHPGDPRAPLAAFTLGRVHLEDLGAPREAALAFARALELAPEGPLAEDALAREVEAWSRAGEADTARARAISYSQRYPDGRRVRAVRRFGGLERP